MLWLALIFLNYYNRRDREVQSSFLLADPSPGIYNLSLQTGATLRLCGYMHL